MKAEGDGGQQESTAISCKMVRKVISEEQRLSRARKQ